MNANSEPVGALDVALAHTQRLLKTDPKAAIEQATEILKVVPDQPIAMLLLGLSLGADRQGDAALAALRRAVQLKEDMPDACARWGII